MRSLRTWNFLSGLIGPLLVCGQTDFQQHVDYVIDVRLDDRAHVLHAQESFSYLNNSPSTLDTLWIHLWPNAYRDRTTALCKQHDITGDLDLHFATEEERGWIDSLDFRADEMTVSWGHHPIHPDIGWIKLNTPLAPGAQVKVSTPFRVKIPNGKFSRLGHSEQAYYITQWYPKPAVFDAQGWHAMPYLTQGEFYSEFGSFDVRITLPENYVVGATGRLTDSEAEERFMAERAALPVVQLNSNSFPPSAASTKTIRYTQDRVHDFAWFADKRFIVRSSEVVLPRSGRPVKTWALFTPKNAALWADAVSYVNESVRFYSEWVGDYPYDACTAIDGTIAAGGGMEYPMITIIGDMGTQASLDNVIAHEVGHNWFYGILGSNEREHAWMDEGMNSFVELQYMRKRYPGGGLTIGGLEGLSRRLGILDDGHRQQNELMYRFNARRNLDQPIELSSPAFTSTNYGCMVYAKSALVFDHLLAYLGDETMKRCLNGYFEAWKFKHPQPEDVRQVFELESAKNLRWVFDEFVRTDRKIDVRVVGLKDSSMSYRTNSNGYIPFSVSAWNGADSLGTAWFLSGRMQSGYFKDQGPPIVSRQKVDAPLPWPNADRIRIDAGNRTLDIDRRNNSVRSHGLFRRWAPVRFKWLLGLEQNDARTVYYTPLPAWNGNDGWQLGMAAYNTTFPSQRTEWVVAPLYGFASERWGGAARIEHHFDRMRSDLFQNITLGVSGRSASEFLDHENKAWYDKVSPYMNLDLKRDPLNRPWQHRIALRGVYLNKGGSYRTGLTDMTTTSDERYYTEIRYTAEDRRKLHRSLIAPTLTYNDEFLRASLELRQAFALNDHNDEIRFRAFVGSFLWKRNDLLSSGLHAWGLTWGTEDMLYDHAYLERNARDQFARRQYNTQQGAFKTPFLQGGSDTWIGALNMEIDVPVPLPIALFGSVGTAPVTTVTADGRSTSGATYFEAGLGVIAIRDVMEIWFPLVVSDRIADEEKFLDRSVTDRIRFIFAFEQLDPTRAIRNLRP